MGNTGWKQFERRVARDHGVERQPITGERDGSDAMPHPRYVFQMKLRERIPVSIRTWADSIFRCGDHYGKTGVLILKEPGKRDDSALVVLRYRDWLAIQLQLAGQTNLQTPPSFSMDHPDRPDAP